MRLEPCVRYYRPDGKERVYWLEPRETVSCSAGEAAIAHVIAECRAERGTDVRIEFYHQGGLKERVHVLLQPIPDRRPPHGR